MKVNSGNKSVNKKSESINNRDENVNSRICSLVHNQLECETLSCSCCRVALSMIIIFGDKS